MKIMKRMMSLAAAILALSACSESEDLLSAFHSDPNAVRITAEVGKASANGFTRSYPLGDAEAQKKFKEGDMISVQADGQDAVTYQLNGNEWQPQGGKFLKWESNEMNFTAYYPASFDGDLNNITLPKEYDEASLAANDFMSYSGKQSNTNGNQLTLTMERKMARVVVEIAGFNDQYAGATVNSLSICGIKAYKHTDNKFYALIKPCDAQSTANFLSLEVGEGNAKETLTGIPALAAGKSYTYQLTVGKNKVSVTGITVADWTTGEAISGKAELYTPYLTFTAEGAQNFKMTTNGNYDLSMFQYSVNGGEWKNVVEDEPVSFGGENSTLRLRGTNPNGTATNFIAVYSIINFTNLDAKVACTGDIRTLLDWRNYENVATDQASFCHLFSNCKVLTSAPKLPATILVEGCYKYMFQNCTSLTSAPELPATNLRDECYKNMFNGCTSLESAPKLSAKSLAQRCCEDMFLGCTSLKSAPELSAETLTSGCYAGMFDKCTSLESAPKLPATELQDQCYNSMFSGCTSLKSAPELPAETLASGCYYYMFNGCTNLTSVTMLAPSDQIKNTPDCCAGWLDSAGTKEGITRTLKVKDKEAYKALESTNYLPAIWKKDQCTVEYYTPKQ